jgi:hypothetical protein
LFLVPFFASAACKDSYYAKDIEMLMRGEAPDYAIKKNCEKECVCADKFPHSVNTVWIRAAYIDKDGYLAAEPSVVAEIREEFSAQRKAYIDSVENPEMKRLKELKKKGSLTEEEKVEILKTLIPD